MSRNYYTSGQWNLICDVCGKKVKAHKAKHRWDGFVVCEKDWEERHSQDFVRARQNKISVPFTRPRPPDLFITPVCTFITHIGQANVGTADCAQADNSPEYTWADWVAEFCSIEAMYGIAGGIVTGKQIGRAHV